MDICTDIRTDIYVNGQRVRTSTQISSRSGHLLGYPCGCLCQIIRATYSAVRPGISKILASYSKK